jgi:hypothetical protein
MLNRYLRTRAARDQYVIAILRDRPPHCHKPVASSRGRRNIAPVFRSISKGLAQHKDVLAQVRLLHKGIRPYTFNKVVLGHNLAAVSNKDQQSFKNLKSNRDRLILAQQHRLGGVLVNVLESMKNQQNVHFNERR